MLKAVIFDYDGVLVNTDSFNKYSLKESLKKKGLPFTDETFRKYFTGRTLKDGLTMFLSEVGRASEIEEFVALKKSYDSEYGAYITAYDDAFQLIETLKQKYRLAIATGARRILIDSAIRKFGLARIFEAIVCAEDYVKGKPNPEIYLTTLHRMNLSSDEAVIIEDAPYGITAAHSAGIRCIAVTHTHTPEELKEADIIVNNLQEIELGKL